MGGTKGSAINNVGYSCEMRELIKGWRASFSETPGATDPMAPFGIITLASSGSEGGPNMGAMRLAQVSRPLGHAVIRQRALSAIVVHRNRSVAARWPIATRPQTAGYGVVPNPQLPNTFFAQVCTWHACRLCACQPVPRA